jgi:glycosyltransferase involved in cell wall biosynthesis
MRILVGNNGLGLPGGSETYTYALIKELVKRGHDVTAVGKDGPGLISRKLEELGVECFFTPVWGNYDLILLSHSSSIHLAKDAIGFKVQTCHGIYPSLEQPVPGIDAYVSISEEVYNHLKSKGFDSTIIPNGIDCDRYKPKTPINDKLKTVLSLAHSEPANEIIKQACKIANVNLIINNKFKEWKWEVDEIINKSDLVISLGRGAYEAMATGRNVVIFDQRNYTNMPAVGDGIITKDNVDDYLKNNCSGRYTKRVFDAQILAEEILKYNPQHGKDLREYALENLNIEKQVDKYLNLNKNL